MKTLHSSLRHSTFWAAAAAITATFLGCNAKEAKAPRHEVVSPAEPVYQLPPGDEEIEYKNIRLFLWKQVQDPQDPAARDQMLRVLRNGLEIDAQDLAQLKLRLEGQKLENSEANAKRRAYIEETEQSNQRIARVSERLRAYQALLNKPNSPTFKLNKNKLVTDCFNEKWSVGEVFLCETPCKEKNACSNYADKQVSDLATRYLEENLQVARRAIERELHAVDPDGTLDGRISELRERASLKGQEVEMLSKSIGEAVDLYDSPTALVIRTSSSGQVDIALKNFPSSSYGSTPMTENAVRVSGETIERETTKLDYSTLAGTIRQAVYTPKGGVYSFEIVDDFRSLAGEKYRDVFAVKLGRVNLELAEDPILREMGQIYLSGDLVRSRFQLSGKSPGDGRDCTDQAPCKLEIRRGIMKVVRHELK